MPSSNSDDQNRNPRRKFAPGRAALFVALATAASGLTVYPVAKYYLEKNLSKNAQEAGIDPALSDVLAGIDSGRNFAAAAKSAEEYEQAIKSLYQIYGMPSVRVTNPDGVEVHIKTNRPPLLLPIDLIKDEKVTGNVLAFISEDGIAIYKNVPREDDGNFLIDATYRKGTSRQAYGDDTVGASGESLALYELAEKTNKEITRNNLIEALALKVASGTDFFEAAKASPRQYEALIESLALAKADESPGTLSVTRNNLNFDTKVNTVPRHKVVLIGTDEGNVAFSINTSTNAIAAYRGVTQGPEGQFSVSSPQRAGTSYGDGHADLAEKLYTETEAVRYGRRESGTQQVVSK